MIAAKMKKEWTELSSTFFRKIKINKPVSVRFTWHEQNTRRDPDNIIFAKKFILDGLVISGALPNDNQQWIKSFSESWFLDKESPGVEIALSW